MDKKTPKTFEDLGLKFVEDLECVTCQNYSCHNNVTRKEDGQEYNVHISMDEEKTMFTVYAIVNLNVESEDDINLGFVNEEEAVKYLCENFNGFQCA